VGSVKQLFAKPKTPKEFFQDRVMSPGFQLCLIEYINDQQLYQIKAPNIFVDISLIAGEIEKSLRQSISTFLLPHNSVTHRPGSHSSYAPRKRRYSDTKSHKTENKHNPKTCLDERP
jgi:hypothetical protein